MATLNSSSSNSGVSAEQSNKTSNNSNSNNETLNFCVLSIALPGTHTGSRVVVVAVVVAVMWRLGWRWCGGWGGGRKVGEGGKGGGRRGRGVALGGCQKNGLFTDNAIVSCRRTGAARRCAGPALSHGVSSLWDNQVPLPARDGRPAPSASDTFIIAPSTCRPGELHSRGPS